MLNKRLYKIKKLLIINFNLDEGDNREDFIKLLHKLGIKVPNTIPTLLLFRYNPNKKHLLQFEYETISYGMWNTNKWLNNMVILIMFIIYDQFE
jgi:hypothetical protein